MSLYGILFEGLFVKYRIVLARPDQSGDIHQQNDRCDSDGFEFYRRGLEKRKHKEKQIRKRKNQNRMLQNRLHPVRIGKADGNRKQKPTQRDELEFINPSDFTF